MMRRRISVVVNTLNEEANLPFALGSVAPWADELVVVDMHSDDRTAEVARSFGARVLLHERTAAVDGARAFALEQATGDWVLVLDADEMVQAPLARELRRIAEGDEADVVMLPMVQHLFGAPVMHSGWGPTQNAYPRFFRRGAVRATDQIHAFFHSAPDARVLVLPYREGHAVVHFNQVDVAHFIDKMNRYTTVEAAQAHRMRRVGPLGALLRAGWDFAKRFFWLGAWRDGWRGFYLCALMASYRLAAYAKLEELAQTGGRDAVLRAYRAEAERILAAYGDARPAVGANAEPRVDAVDAQPATAERAG